MRWAVVALLVLANPRVASAAAADFAKPEAVVILGYDDHAMEPFITRDGRYLLFNNSNEIPAETDLHIAERIDDRTFQYLGRLEGANSPDLDGVPAMDSAGNIYFVTLRSYARDLTTIYRGRLEKGVVTDVVPLTTLTRGIPGQLNFDVDVSSDGSVMYFVDGLFSGGPVPVAADLAVAIRGADGIFRRVTGDGLDAVNTSALEYAAAISNDGLELFFTRIVNGTPGIYRAIRATPSAPWGTAKRVDAITGFVEAPALSPSGNALYYHARRGDRFVIERVTRSGPSRRRAVPR
jgi:hypothetical protein